MIGGDYNIKRNAPREAYEALNINTDEISQKKKCVYVLQKKCICLLCYVLHDM